MEFKRTPEWELDQIIMKPPLWWTWDSEDSGTLSVDVVARADYERLLEVAKKLRRE
jgi:hypothetical protein